MKLVAGLGNFEPKYCFTRHNAGFMAVDMYAITKNLAFKEEKKLKCYIAKSNDIILIKPTTYMNLSGEAVEAVMNYYKIPIEDVLIVFDDLSIDIGKIRFRAEGSDGGHNGIKSVIKHAGTNKIARLKIGIGPQPNIPSETFVLQNFTQVQLDTIKPVLKKCTEAIDFYFENGIAKTQNYFN